MKIKASMLDRVLLLLTGLLAAYQVASGINGLELVPVIAYTIAFGVLLVAVLLLIILGMDVLESPIVVIVSTIIPLSLSLGLIWQFLQRIRIAYLVFVIVGLLAVIFTRLKPIKNKLPTLIVATVHGVAGMVIFLLPSVIAAKGIVHSSFALVGFGGALIGIGGLLLSFLKAGKPILQRDQIYRIFPALLLIMTISLVIGFSQA